MPTPTLPPMPDALRPAGTLTPAEAARLAALQSRFPIVLAYRVGEGWRTGWEPGTLVAFAFPIGGDSTGTER